MNLVIKNGKLIIRGCKLFKPPTTSGGDLELLTADGHKFTTADNKTFLVAKEARHGLSN